eukprot:gene15944-biopygen2203
MFSANGGKQNDSISSAAPAAPVVRVICLRTQEDWWGLRRGQHPKLTKKRFHTIQPPISDFLQRRPQPPRVLQEKSHRLIRVTLLLSRQPSPPDQRKRRYPCQLSVHPDRCTEPVAEQTWLQATPTPRWPRTGRSGAHEDSEKCVKLSSEEGETAEGRVRFFKFYLAGRARDACGARAFLQISSCGTRPLLFPPTGTSGRCRGSASAASSARAWRCPDRSDPKHGGSREFTGRRSGNVGGGDQGQALLLLCLPFPPVLY